MRYRMMSFAVPVWLAGAACRGREVHMAAAPGGVSLPEGEARQAAGLLLAVEVPATKSLEAYRASPYVLEVGSERWPLAPGEVEAAALAAAVGEQVEVELRWQPPLAPEPWESAPVGLDGAPELRPGVWRVQALREAPSGH